jgi:hypothetical protein
MEAKMKRAIVVATAVLFGTSAFALAADDKGSGSTTATGQEKQNSSNPGATKGASESSPANHTRDKGTIGMSKSTTKGGSENSPGGRLNEGRRRSPARTTRNFWN